MMHKDEESYVSVLSEINKLWIKYEVSFKRMHVDYEQANINALWGIYGKQRIFGCIFHFCSALIKYIRTEFPKISRLYHDDKRGLIYKWVGILNKL